MDDPSRFLARWRTDRQPDAQLTYARLLAAVGETARPSSPFCKWTPVFLQDLTYRRLPVRTEHSVYLVDGDSAASSVRPFVEVSPI